MGEVPLISQWKIQLLQNQQYNFRINNFTHMKEFFNKECGDKCEVFLVIKDKKIEKISYTLHGCGIQTAALELVCKQIENKSSESVIKIKEEILQFPIEKNRAHCIYFVNKICEWIIDCIRE